MKILVVGGGGREHALVWKLAQDSGRPVLFCAPGNAGTAEMATNLPIAATDVPGLVAWAKRERPDLTVVGPEAPLCAGLTDRLQELGLLVFGPSAAAAQMEGSKVFSKDIMAEAGVPTGASASFTDIAAARAYLHRVGAPIVIKADGLAAGKGVIVAQTHAEAEAGVRTLLALPGQGRPGKILVEDCLTGEETSLLVVVSGRDYIILPTSQDHKRIGDGDTGPNTGGMGTYSPAEVVTPALLEQIDREIVRPSVDGIAAEGIDFRGTLFIGIMLTPEGPSVLEYNTRFGDPETQVVLPRVSSDVLDLLWSAAIGKLSQHDLQVRPEHALCVVIAAKGYPEAYPKGDVIQLPAPLPPQITVFHAGTARNGAGQVVTAGGRVLGVTAIGSTLPAAAEAAYAICDQVVCSSKYFRRDIGAKQLKRQ